MRIGYCKLGRSWNIDPSDWSVAGGDVDVYRLLQRLALAHPEDEFILVGRNSGENPADVGLPPNVVNPWSEWRGIVPTPKSVGFNPKDPQPGMLAMCHAFDALTGPTFDSLDGILVWAGQHGTSNSPIPPVGKGWGDPLTNPQISFVNYGAYIIRGINRWRSAASGQREEIWLVPDPRNYVKCRDLKWPLREDILAQYQQTRQIKHERYADMREAKDLGFEGVWEGQSVWISKQRMEYSGLELTALADPKDILFNRTPIGRQEFGMVINENRREVTNSRIECVKRWVLPHWPEAEIRGIWSDASKELLQRPDIAPVPHVDLYPTLARWRCTLTTPASGSGWATAKPWECFATGTVCFFHPGYDTQNWILPKGKLRDWLRVDSPAQLKKRVDACQDDATWSWLVHEQRKLFEERFAARQIESLIEARLGMSPEPVIVAA